MKKLTSYNRAAGYLNKIFDLLNDEYFDSALPRPTITIQSTPRCFAHFSLRDDTWVSSLGATHEINIGAGTLARPIENVVATLLHEMVHYYNHVNGIQDTSRGTTYHNRRFKEAAESRGLIIDHHPTYGYSLTSPSDDLLDFVLFNGLTDILISRNEFCSIPIPVDANNSNSFSSATNKPSNSRKYICRCCGTSVRATRNVNIGCWDCDEQMVLAG